MQCLFEQNIGKVVVMSVEMRYSIRDILDIRYHFAVSPRHITAQGLRISDKSYGVAPSYRSGRLHDASAKQCIEHTRSVPFNFSSKI